MDTLYDLRARTLSTPNNHEFVDMEEAEGIYAWLSGISEHIEENALDIQDEYTSNDPASISSGPAQQDEREVHVVPSASGRYTEVFAEDSTADDIAHAYRDFAPHTRQAQSQASLDPSNAPREDLEEEMDILSPLLPGWTRQQAAVSPTLPNIERLLNEAEQFEERPEYQPSQAWQENWEPQSPRLVPYERYQDAAQQQPYQLPLEHRYRGPTTNFDAPPNGNYHHFQPPMPEQAPVRAPLPAPHPPQDEALFPGHHRSAPQNWIPENELTPGHRAARMDALEWEYQLHELDYMIYLRQCELAREWRR